MVNIYLVIQNPLKKINYEETPSFYFNNLLILITTYSYLSHYNEQTGHQKNLENSNNSLTTYLLHRPRYVVSWL